MVNNFSQYIHNKPLPRFTTRGQQSIIKKFKETGIGCTLLKPKPLDMEFDVPSGTCSTYTKKIRENRMRYNKSCDDMRLVKEEGNGEESEVDE